MKNAFRSCVVGLMLMLSMIGCSHLALPLQKSIENVPLNPGESYLSNTKIRHLQNATGLYQAFDKDGHQKWAGTAWAFYQGVHFSGWMTCRHVAEDSGDNAKIIYRNKRGVFATGSVFNVKINQEPPEGDMAFFQSEAEPADILELAGQELENNLHDYYKIGTDFRGKPPILMISSGHIGPSYPSVVTVGVFQGYDDTGLRSTVGGWYGVSGSALVDLNTMTVVGMRYRFVDSIFSNQISSVPVGMIRSFLSGITTLDD